MIGFIAGELVSKAAPHLLVDVNGVGYEVQASLATFVALPALGQRVRLLTHFVVREDAQLLYGFVDESERRLFRALIKVNGVGPKLALAILSGMDASGFANCVKQNDIKSLTGLPGVGKKTAQRLVIEMRDRMADWYSADGVTDASANLDDKGAAQGHNVLVAEAETALVALGYKPVEASKAIARLDLSVMGSAEDAIRAALQSMIQR
ncbi:MAG: Holliday junction branch migration protein RuvA [Pseudomonadales bacterium]|nr:Holliday junction branch migration protein RuvA [Pseudomonadales bacterium]NNL11882.1 Holliday junction branch migration protein RuvA [Pseudomonadales bacterium]